MTDHLESLATRLEGDPFFLACTLKDYAHSEGLDNEGLASALGCDRETLAMLRLCRTPDATRFRDDIDRIASRFGVNRDVLMLAVRRGQAIVAMARQPEQSSGMLLAARDDERPQSDRANEEKAS
jgi:hypothetical protein